LTVVDEEEDFLGVNIRERRYSARYSDLLTAEQKKGTISAEEPMSFLANPAKRKQKVIRFVVWGILNVFLTLYLLALIVCFWDLKTGCADKLDNWLTCVFISQICHLLRRMILIILWVKAKDPAV